MNGFRLYPSKTKDCYQEELKLLRDFYQVKLDGQEVRYRNKVGRKLGDKTALGIYAKYHVRLAVKPLRKPPQDFAKQKLVKYPQKGVSPVKRAVKSRLYMPVIFFVIALELFVIAVILLDNTVTFQAKYISPLAAENAYASGIESEEVANKVVGKFDETGPTELIAEGKASYYSKDGCLGCHEQQIMANGEVFDENDHTLAMPAEWRKSGKVQLNTKKCPECGFVRVTNLNTGVVVNGARITDTGGFLKYGRVADLSKGLAEALGLKTDKTTIRIEQLPVMPQSD